MPADGKPWRDFGCGYSPECLRPSVDIKKRGVLVRTLCEVLVAGTCALKPGDEFYSLIESLIDTNCII